MIAKKTSKLFNYLAVRSWRVILICLVNSILLVEAAKTVDVTDFKTAGYEKDATPIVMAAIDFCRRNRVDKLIFPKAKYNFRKEFAVEKYLYISNNDEGLKRIVFDLSEITDFEIDANGSEFIFNGFLCPFLLENSKNIVLKNFSIDYTRTFHSEGKIVAVGDKYIDLEISKEYPYQLDNNILIFKDNEGEKYPWANLLEFDAKKRETAQYAKDYYRYSNVSFTQLQSGRVRLQSDIKGTIGNVLTFGPSHRLVPAVTISDSKDIKISGISIYHSGGMGIIAQRSGNIFLQDVKVTPAPSKDRIVSCTADATHFSGCYGQIELKNCLFENQKDDATNIHGVYVRLEKFLSDSKIIVRLIHPQQFGDGFIRPNDRVEFVDPKSLKTKSYSSVKSILKINKEQMVVEFDAPLDKTLRSGDALAQINQFPSVLIKGCTIRNNRARGILLGSRGKIVVDSNYFHTPGSAILFEGDASHWYEQAGVRNVEIKNNVFDNCNFGVWGKACIQVGSGIVAENRDSNNYNQNVVLKNNLFRIFDPRILNVYAIDGLVFDDNKIEKTVEYVSKYSTEQNFIIEGCLNVSIQKINQVLDSANR